jgi:hypothetical protein
MIVALDLPKRASHRQFSGGRGNIRGYQPCLLLYGGVDVLTRRGEEEGIFQRRALSGLGSALCPVLVYTVIQHLLILTRSDTVAAVT